MGRECILRQYEPLHPDHRDTRSRVRRVRYAERRALHRSASSGRQSRSRCRYAFEYSSSSDSDEDTSSSDSDEDSTSSDSDEDSFSPLPQPEVVEEAAAPHHDSSYGMDVVSLSNQLHNASLEDCHDVQGWLGDSWAGGDGADFSPSGFLGEEFSTPDESTCLAPVVEETVSVRSALYGASSVSRTLPWIADSDNDASDSDKA